MHMFTFGNTAFQNALLVLLLAGLLSAFQCEDDNGSDVFVPIIMEAYVLDTSIVVSNLDTVALVDAIAIMAYPNPDTTDRRNPVIYFDRSDFDLPVGRVDTIPFSTFTATDGRVYPQDTLPTEFGCDFIRGNRYFTFNIDL